MCNASQLDHPNPAENIILVVDTHIGGVLQQKVRQDRSHCPVSARSCRRLSPVTQHLMGSCRLFFLGSCTSGTLSGFYVLTDLKPPTAALHIVTEPCSARQKGQLAYIAKFTADILHIADQENVVPYTLFRLAATGPASPIWVHEAASASSTPGTGS